MNERHHGKGTRLYRIWSAMKTRCYNPNSEAYPIYGGRGITVCDEWRKDFSAFHDWAMCSGYNDELTIDRINGDEGYSPGNCRWATYKTQANNTSRNVIVSYKGQTGTVAEICGQLGINPFLIYDRITRLGWDADKALSTPPRKIHKKVGTQ